MISVHARMMARMAFLPALLLLLMMHLPVRAVEGPPAARMLLDYLRIELNLQPRVGSITTAGNGDTVLHDVVFAEVRKEGRLAFRVSARQVLLHDAAQRDDLMHYRQIVVHDLLIELAAEDEGKEGGSVRIPQILLAEASILPRSKATTPQEQLAAARLLASVISMPEVQFRLPGLSPFDWRGLKGTWQGNRRTGEGTMKVDFGMLKLPLAELGGQNRQRLKLLEALKLTAPTFIGSHESVSKWRADQHLVSTSTWRIGVQEGGELAISLKDLAVPLELIRQVQRISREMQQAQTSGADGQPQEAPGMETLNDPQVASSLRTLTLGGLDIRWQDFGLVRRYVAWEAKQRGMVEEEYIAELLQQQRRQWKSIVPEDMLQQTMREMTRFLMEPKNLRISFRGVGGRPIQLAGLTMLLFMPQMVMNSIRVEVKANE